MNAFQIGGVAAIAFGSFVIGLRAGGIITGMHNISCCKCAAASRDSMQRYHGVRCNGAENHGLHPGETESFSELKKLLPPL